MRVYDSMTDDNSLFIYRTHAHVCMYVLKNSCHTVMIFMIHYRPFALPPKE